MGEAIFELGVLFAKALGILMNLVIVIIFVAGAVLLVAYIVSSNAYRRVMLACNYPHPAAAWVPIWREWAIAACAIGAEKSVNLAGVSIPAVIVKLWYPLYHLVRYVPVVGRAISYPLCILARAWIFTVLFAKLQRKELHECVGLGVLSGFFPIIAWVIFLKDAQPPAYSLGN